MSSSPDIFQKSGVGVRDFFEKVRLKAQVVWPLEIMDYGQMEFGIRFGF